MRRPFKNLLCPIIGLFVLCFANAAFAGEIPGTYKFVLDNGLTVLVKEMPSSPVVALNAMVKIGSAEEGRYLGAGISHFIEHMVFKGTQKRAPGQISQEVKALGGVINASTSFDRTDFLIDVPAGRFKQALDILADMMMNAKFDVDDLKKEREVVVGEMRLYRDNPARRLNDMEFETVYTRHPYRVPVIGYEPLFRKLKRKDLVAFYHAHYVPNNMIISIAGHIKADEALKAVKAAFKDFPRSHEILRVLPQEPPQITPRHKELRFPTDQARLAIVFPSVSVLNPDLYALDVLAVILGQGESSRLYRDVYEKKALVYSISAENYTPMDQGLFEIAAVLDDAKIPDAIAAIKKEVKTLQRKAPSQEELRKAKTSIKSQYVFARQRAESVAYEMALSEAFTGDYKFDDKYLEGIAKVTPKDIQRVARKYFRDNAMNIVLVRPEQKQASGQLKGEEAKEKAPSYTIEKKVLSNGLTVLMREDHTFPLVAMGVILRGGVHEEPAGKNGIGNLMAQLWTRGTKKHTATEIAELVEERGGRLNAFSGKYSFGLTFEGLSQDSLWGMSLLAEVVTSPIFSDKELGQVKRQVASAIKDRDNNIYAATSKALLEDLFTKNPLHFSILGDLVTIKNITRQDIVTYYNLLMSPNNMVLYVFGNFNKEEMYKKIVELFGALPRKTVTLKGKIPEPPLTSPKEEIRHMQKEQAVIMVGFHAPSLKDKDTYAMQVIDNILGASLNGRLFVKVRDRLGKAYRLGGHYTPGLDAGYIYFYVATTKENINKVKEAIFDMVKEFRQNPLSSEELKNTKIYLTGSHTMSLETNSALGFSSALDERYGLGFDHFKKYNDLINAVTVDQIQAVAGRYLDPSKAVIVVTESEKKKPEGGKSH